MALIDGLVLGFIFLSALLGFFRGFIHESLNLISWVGALSLAYAGLPPLNALAQKFIHNSLIASITGQIVYFIILMAIFKFLSQFLINLVRGTILNGLDRAMGSFYGVFRGGAVICLFHLLASCFVKVEQYPVQIRENRFMPIILVTSEKLIGVMPKKVRDLVITQQNLMSSTPNGRKHQEPVLSEQLKSLSEQEPLDTLADDIIDSLKNTQKVSTEMTDHPVKKPEEQKTNQIFELNKRSHQKTLKNQEDFEKLAKLEPAKNFSNTPEKQSGQTEGVTVKQEKALDRFLNSTNVEEDMQDLD